MVFSPTDIAGDKLTEHDKEHLRDWLNWIDEQLIKFRYNQKLPEADGSLKVKLSAKIPTSKQIIDAILYIYRRRGWSVNQAEQESPQGKFRYRYLIFEALTPAQLEILAALEAQIARPKKTAQNKVGYVYLVKAENGLYKIGRSKTPDVRISTITKTIGPIEIQTIHTAFYPDCYKAESELHQMFKEKRRRGEWFELTDNEVMKVIAYTYGGA